MCILLSFCFIPKGASFSQSMMLTQVSSPHLQTQIQYRMPVFSIKVQKKLYMGNFVFKLLTTATINNCGASVSFDESFAFALWVFSATRFT